jgi:hypothetical protein
VSDTRVFGGKNSEQSLPHEMRPGLDVTVPEPLPERVTTSEVFSANEAMTDAPPAPSVN